MEGNQSFTYTATTRGRLVSTKDFENIILRSDTDGGALRLKGGGAGRARLAELQLFGHLQRLADRADRRLSPARRQCAAGRGEHQGTMDRLSQRFPEGLRYDAPFDTTRFVEVSVREVIYTFAEAISLVVLVVFLFLQNWRPR